MDVFDLFAKISIDISEFEKGLSAASSKFQSFSNNLSKAGSGMKDLLSPAVDGFKAVEGVGKKAGNVITTGLKGFAAAATAVGGFGTAAVNSGMKFDAAMSEVSAISGATGEEFQSLRDKALEMGAKTKFSASEAGEAMTYMAMAGWKTGDMLGGIEGIMNLAAASGEDLATTSDIVTDALTAFGMTASESGHFADVLAAASSNANTNVAMMGETFKYAAPIAGAMGYTAEDTALAIGLMANSSIKSSQAGTSLRSILTRLTKPTKESSAAMDALGISIKHSDGRMKSLGEIIVDLRTSFSNLDKDQKPVYASMLAGQEAMSGLLAIVNAAPEDFEKLTQALNDCDGASDRMSKTMMDNLSGDIQYFKSALESLQIAISDSLTPTLREFAQFGQRAMAGLLEGFQGGGVSGFMSALSGFVTEGVTMLAEKAPEFASVSLQFIQALADGLLNAGDTIIASGYEVVWTLIGGIGEWISSNSDELLHLGNELVWHILNGFLGAGDLISENIGKFIPLIVNAFTAYHEALFTVGLDILGAIGQGFVGNKDEIQRLASLTISNMVTSLRDNAPMIIEGGIALLEALVGAITENLPLIIETGATIIGELVAGIATASPGVQAIIGTAVLPHILKIVDTVGKIGGAVSNMIGIVQPLISGIVKFVSGGLTTIIGIGSKLMGGIKLLFGLIAANPVVAIIAGIIATVVLLYTKCEWFRDAVHAVIDAVAGFFQWALDKIVAAWEGAGEFFGGIVDSIKGVFDGIGEFLAGLFTAAWELVQGAWGAAVDFFSGIWDGIQGVFSVVADVLGGFFSTAWDAVRAVWDTVVGVFQTIADGIHAAFEAVTGFLGDAFSAAWNAITGIWNAAVGFFSGVWSGISGVFSSVASWFGGIFSRAWTAVTTAWSGVTAFFSGVWSKITSVFSSVGEKFKSIGKSIVDGLKNGVLGAWNSFIGFITNKVGGIITTVKSLLGIHSPSTVFAGIGENMALGLGEGWNDEYTSIKRKITSGLDFGTATVGLSANGSYSTPGMGWNGPQTTFGGGGDTYVTINSPVAVDAVTAAREWKKTTQRLAMGYV